jgi:cytochrome c
MKIRLLFLMRARAAMANTCHSHAVFVASLLLLAAPVDGAPSAPATTDAMVKIPGADIANGRKLFVTKSCVLCHSVNDVGGDAAALLDAAPGQSEIDLMDFSARMWRGAEAMTFLQSKKIGYVIDLNGNEITDLAAFLSNSDAQKSFTIDDVPEAMRESFVDDPNWDSYECPDVGASDDR